MAGSRKKASTGAKALKGSATARRHLAVLLEALSGLRGTTEAAEAMGVSLSRYYQLETRALNGMLAALEPRPRGPTQSPQKAIALLQREKRALEREVSRHQALLRAAQRSVGVVPAKKGGSGRGKRRQRGSRGGTVLKTLREEAPATGGGTGGATDEGAPADGGDRGQS